MKQSKRRKIVVLLSIVIWLLSLIVINNFVESEKTIFNYLALYISSLSLIITPLFVYMVYKRRVIYLYISHPSTEDKLYRAMKSVVVENGKFAKENYIVKELSSLKTIPKHTFFIAILSDNINSRQKFEIKTMVASAKPIFVFCDSSVDIPQDLQNYKLVRISKSSENETSTKSI